MAVSPVISLSDAAGLLGRGECVFVDCRFDLQAPESGVADYLKAHIRGARYAHLDRDLSRPRKAGEGRHPLPDTDAFLQWLGSSGIEPNDHVVVYDDQSGAIAARLWWLLRWVGHRKVSALDGDFTGWRKAGLPLSSGEEVWAATDYLPGRIQRGWVVSTAEVENLDLGKSVLLDARAAIRFAGEKEPIDPVAGHIPIAINWPFTESLGVDGAFKAPEKIAGHLDALTGNQQKDVIVMCGSGVTACHLLLALATAGIDGRLYVGSWSEWITDPVRPIALGI